ncbi:glycoside hydrolase [Bombardia bombarda]|uniref:Glycoside hydrolase n=1 Tax=Bombardia bombarda TaxID=252184 RepID=A0AA40C945_9PEZI|nr:glycoside hydrolase [Bombardia bombarda]
MVSTKWGSSLAAHIYLLLFSHLAGRAAAAPTTSSPSSSSYRAETLTAVKALQSWYNPSTGLWNTAGWWNSANCLQVLADWTMTDNSSATTLINVPGIMQNTFTKAQQTTVSTQKTVSARTGHITSTYTLQAKHIHGNSRRGFSGFINDFYDDEGWWALALIRSWDATRNAGYLATAESIFADMVNGTDAVCGGGVWWSKARKYKNAIANELYLSVAAALARRVPDAGRRARYLQTAKDQWGWFRRSGMINGESLINDGLTIKEDGSCVNNGAQTWSYNQGVVLGGLVELAYATGDVGYVREAVPIAVAAVKKLTTTVDGVVVIREVDRCEPDCGLDGPQFKGVFVRNLGYLVVAVSTAPERVLKGAIEANARSVWNRDRESGTNRLGISWAGPVSAGQGPNASTHSSAMDVLVAARGVAGLSPRGLGMGMWKVEEGESGSEGAKV